MTLRKHHRPYFFRNFIRTEWFITCIGALFILFWSNSFLGPVYSQTQVTAGDQYQEKIKEQGSSPSRRPKHNVKKNEILEKSPPAQAYNAVENAVMMVTHKMASLDYTFWFIRLLRIVFIVLAARLLWKFFNVTVEKYVHRFFAFKKRKNSKTASFFKTMMPIVKSVVHWALIVLTSLIVISDVGIDITPIILSFSVVGLAFSFGSQELVKDFINGILTLFDGHIAVGDYVKIGDSMGVIETLSLRAIVLRNPLGELQTIPFSDAKSITNCSRHFTTAKCVVSLSPYTPLKDVDDAFQEAFQALQQNVGLAPFIHSPLSPIGVETISWRGADVTAFITVMPERRQKIISEFQRLLMAALQKRGAKFAYDIRKIEDLVG